MVNIDDLKKSHDIRGLIRLLDHGNSDIQWHAADALGNMGEAACDPLLRLLDFPKVNVRLGAIDALGEIKSPRSVDNLIRKLKDDTDDEVRWAASIALGQIGDPRAIPALEEALKDDDRYVRYGAIKSLEMLNWTPSDETSRAYALIALQDWPAVRKLRSAAVRPLIDINKDPNPVTRTKIVEILGEIGGPDAKKACERALLDRDPGVRWKAVFACKRCGVDTDRIPVILADRPRTIPSAFGAAVLNLFFFGSGYSYIGKWWGILVFLCYVGVIIIIQLNWDVLFPYMYTYPFTAVFAVQTYYMVKRMPDM
ncbi:HEAT repeat domain-containing protein [Methanoregula sp.]|uniref:HEAT repeat domain-containing protein n=1 Tax=Methanoregula sp. TaxID=2052170 RepID=UPI003BAECDCD